MNRVVNGFGSGAYPLDVDALKALQNNTDMLAAIGCVCGGSGAIIVGGVVTGGSHSEGLVWVKTTDYPNGEVLAFPAGSNSAVYGVKTTGQNATSAGTVYSNVHVTRELSVMTGGGFAFSGFYRVDDKSLQVLSAAIKKIDSSIEAIVPNPIGSIVMWPSINMPTGYVACSGQLLSKADYADLYAVLGDTYGTVGNQFRAPDIGGRFVAGYMDNSDTYGLNCKGGEETHLLTVDEMPAHVHNYMYVNGNGDGGIQSGGDRNQYACGTTSAGGNQPHENRPPYIALRYIIKAK